MLIDNSKKGTARYGSAHAKKTRSWTQKKVNGVGATSDRQSVDGELTSRKSTAASIDAADALSILKKKYSSVPDDALEESAEATAVTQG